MNQFSKAIFIFLILDNYGTPMIGVYTGQKWTLAKYQMRIKISVCEYMKQSPVGGNIFTNSNSANTHHILKQREVALTKIFFRKTHVVFLLTTRAPKLKINYFCSVDSNWFKWRTNQGAWNLWSLLLKNKIKNP